MGMLKIAAGQMCSSADLAQNARVVAKLVAAAAAQNAKVLFLPEAADYISRDAAHSRRLASRSHTDFISHVQQLVKRLFDESSGPEEDRGIFVALGVHEPGHDKEAKVQNNQLWIDNRGRILHRYLKLHLFDVNITNGPVLQESRSVEAGMELLQPFPVNNASWSNFHVGLAICYDIRFPELALRLRRLGANILTYPSAFTTRTGEAHWLALGRARAIDSQCYVVMAAQCGSHDVEADLPPEERKGGGPRVSYGQTVVIGPWGEVLAQAPTYNERGETDSDGDYYEIVTADVDLDHVERIRRDLPVFDHRRPEVFGYEV